MKRIENYMVIENQLVQINKQIIELYHKNYNYKINLGMLSNNTNGFLKHIKFINRIMFTMESDELKEQTQSDLIMSKMLVEGKEDVVYTNVPNTDEWKMVTYKNWYHNARTAKEPIWSSVYFKEDNDDKNFIINYSIPVHNRSREGGNAFIMNLEIIGKIINHRY